MNKDRKQTLQKAKDIEKRTKKVTGAKKVEVVYVEPADYIPEEIRKELGLGEYNDGVQDT